PASIARDDQSDPATVASEPLGLVPSHTTRFHRPSGPTPGDALMLLFSRRRPDRRHFLSHLEPLEHRTLLTGSVASLTLVNTDTHKDILTLSNGSTLDVAKLGHNFNIRANTSSGVESVKFGLDSNSAYHTESTAPYNFAGDTGKWAPTLGSHTLKATP